MKKYLPLGILFLIVLVGIGVFFFLGAKSKPFYETQMPQASPVAQSVTAQLLLEPTETSGTIKVGDETSYSVSIAGENAQVVGVESYITFDPSSITIISVEPANLLTDPKTLTSSIDTTNGLISYAIGSFTPSTAQGTLFTIRVRATAAAPTVPFSFDRTKTKVALVDMTGEKKYSQNETQIQFMEKTLSVLP